MADKQTIIVSDAGSKRTLQNAIGKLEGQHRITIEKVRPGRSSQQNAYYFACIATPFADWLSQNWGEPTTPLEAHLILRKKFLKRTKMNKKTGEMLDYIDSSSVLDITDFSRYIDDCCNFLAEYCDIVVPPANLT